MFSVDGDADAAVENGIRIGWNKFRQLVPLLTNKDLSLKVRGRLYSGCVRSSMLHGSETWPVRKENEVRPGLDDIISILQQNKLRWYGHVLRKDDNDWVKKCMEYDVEGARPRGRPKKTGREIMEKDCRVCGLNREDAMDNIR